MRPAELPIVVLKLDSYPLHAGTMGVARSAGRTGADVHVLGEVSASPVARSRYVRSIASPPSAAGSPDRLARWLCEMAPAVGALLVPVDDRGAVFVQQRADQLGGAYCFPRMPAGLAESLADKASLSGLAVAAGVPTPGHSTPATRAELDAFLDRTPLPVVVKMRDPELAFHNPGVPGVAIADSTSVVRDLWARHLVHGRPNCILQEYIPGGAETVWMVNAYADGRSSLRFAATGRKLRQWVPYTGATSLGVCERNDEVLALTARLVEHIGYRGIMDIGWRFDARDGLYKLLDFNPRIGATFRLFAGRRGMDVLRACHLDMAGEPVPADEVPDGRKWMNDAYDLFAAARYMSDGNLTLEAYLRSVRRVDEAAWWDRTDPAPALSTAGLVAREAATLGRGWITGRVRGRVRPSLRRAPAG